MKSVKNKIPQTEFSDDSAGFAVTGHVDGGGKTHIYVSEVDPLGLSVREGQTSESTSR